MGILPKEGDPKEQIGLLPLIVVHYLIGLGIAYVGQRTKNQLEFFCGLAVFVIAIAAIFLAANSSGGIEAFQNSFLGL